MKELIIPAEVDNLQQVLGFVEENLEPLGVSPKTMMQISLAVEEIYVNIASYAYAPGTGDAKVDLEVSEDNSEVTITFTDSGKAYNPLEKEDPDITLGAEERQIGGLGVYMTKKAMDEVAYEYKDGNNVFSMKKKL